MKTIPICYRIKIQDHEFLKNLSEMEDRKISYFARMMVEEGIERIKKNEREKPKNIEKVF